MNEQLVPMTAALCIGWPVHVHWQRKGSIHVLNGETMKHCRKKAAQDRHKKT